MTKYEASALQVGDKVIYYSGGYNSVGRTVTVVRKSGAGTSYLSNGPMVNAHGTVIGGYTAHVEVWTAKAEERNEYLQRRGAALRTVRAANFERLPLEALELMATELRINGQR